MHRFLYRWQNAVFGEVADSIVARAAAGGLSGDAADSIPDVLLAVARLSGRPGMVDTGELKRRGSRVQPIYLARVVAANYPASTASGVAILTLVLLVLATWIHFTVWRRRLLLSTRLYLDDRPTDLPFGGG